MKKTKLKFPEGFLWGAATSAYQVEGGITENDWAVQTRLAKAGDAADHYHRYASDFRLAKRLNQNAHRLSIEWSRVEPEEGVWDDNEIQHYYQVLSVLKKQGFQTFVTLHHFTNPLWVTKKRGWSNPDIADSFAEYAGKMADNLGPLVDFWITINEPGVYTNLGYILGLWPPFKKNIITANRVYQNMKKGHNLAYEIIHYNSRKAQVGLAHNIHFNEPANLNSKLDRLATKVSDYFNITKAFKGVKQDFIGVNYYFHDRVRWSFLKISKNLPPQGNLSDKGWELYPAGLFGVLTKLKQYQKPIYITENGIADAKDEKRGNFIRESLHAVHQAIATGVDVKGYLHWSLLDNYEWPVDRKETGFDMRFGLVEIDFKTQKRKTRKSGKMYAEICKTNALK